MPDLLTELAQDAMGLYQSPPDPLAALELANRIERFAADHENLDPATHTRLLVRVARNLDKQCPAEIDQARLVIAQQARMQERFGE